LLEAVLQKFPDSAAVYLKWLSDLPSAPAFVRNFFQKLSIEALNVGELAANEPRFKVHTAAISGFITEGKRIIHVTHSQGNLFANGLYASLKSKGLHVNNSGKQVYKNIQVATPASFVASGGNHFTFANDIIIAAVRALFPTLPANLGNATRGGFTKHEFVETYLNNAVSVGSIRGAILAAAAETAYPSTQATGPITVTLSWGPQPDLDLHVFEPSGSHVYFDTEIGVSGFLDTDDTESFGPEHYFVKSCSTLQVGKYVVGVNYYEGDAPETATIFINAGGKTITVRKPLLVEMNSDGNDSPSLFANIFVAKNVKTGKFEFRLEQL
jgi:hypothetical protein